MIWLRVKFKTFFLWKNANVSQLETGKNLTTASYSEITRREKKKKNETKNIQKQKLQAHGFKNYRHTYNVNILNCFYPDLQLKNTEFNLMQKYLTKKIERI